MNETIKTENKSSGLPLFYKKPAALSASKHANKSLKKDVNYGFASTTNSLPLNAVEFTFAAKSYPIVFSGDSEVTPVAVLGLRNGENLFVNHDGNWAENTYVPAYARRYPFIFVESADKLTYTLCVDEASDSLVSSTENTFFDAKGEKTQLTNNILNFLQLYQGQSVYTQEFCQAISDAGLLVPNRAEVAMRSGEKLALQGFKVIDEKKFNELSDATYLEFRQKGYISLIVAHLISFQNWSNLISMKANKDSLAHAA